MLLNGCSFFALLLAIQIPNSQLLNSLTLSLPDPTRHYQTRIFFYMSHLCQLFHCLQWYDGSERVKHKNQFWLHFHCQVYFWCLNECNQKLKKLVPHQHSKLQLSAVVLQCPRTCLLTIRGFFYFHQLKRQSFSCKIIETTNDNELNLLIL